MDQNFATCQFLECLPLHGFIFMGITTFFAELTGPKKLEKVNHRQQIRYLLRGYVLYTHTYDMIWYDMTWYDKIWYDMNTVTEYKRNM